MSVDFIHHAPLLVVLPHLRRIDASTSIDFKQEILNYLDTAEAVSQIEIDLQEVDFIDSSGIGALVSVLKNCFNKYELALSHPNKNIMHLLAMTRMDKIFTIKA